MPKPRLLFISNLFPDLREPYRGLDNATLLHHLANRWDIGVLAVRPIFPFGRKGWRPRAADEPLFPRYVPTHYVPMFGHRVNHRMMAGSLRGLVGELRGAFQLALTTSLFPDACAVSILANELQFPLTAIAHGLDVHQDLQNKHRRETITQSLKPSRGIITQSGELARLLSEAGLEKEKLHPILNGIDFDRFQPADALAARQQLGLPLNQRIILFVGKFVGPKNPVLLVEAFARVCADPGFGNASLVFVGAGPLEGEINFHAGRGNTAGRVLVAGRQSPETVAKFMQAADVLCVPSNVEGVPNVVLEAFACGLRVVATRVGGIPEVHAADYLGQLVAPRDAGALADALKLVLDTLPERNRIREYAKRFTWEKTADQYHLVLSKAIG